MAEDVLRRVLGDANYYRQVHRVGGAHLRLEGLDRGWPVLGVYDHEVEPDHPIQLNDAGGGDRVERADQRFASLQLCLEWILSHHERALPFTQTFRHCVPRTAASLIVGNQAVSL